MKNKIWLMFSLILVLSGFGFSQTAKKTVTNSDLEKFKQKRLQSESEYRAKYKELGMPSPEEIEQNRLEEQARLANLSQKIRTDSRQKQDYWQSQANLLRNELININAQINFLNKQLATLPSGNKVFYTNEELNGLVIPSYGYGRGRGQRNTVNNINPANNVQTAINAAAANPNPYQGTPLYQTGIKAVIGPEVTPRGYRRNYGYGGYYPAIVNSGNSQRDELIGRLQYLLQIRAGLLAQWQNLVEEAHRAGVRIN